MNNQKESKQVRMDSWLLKLLSRDINTKNNTKINQQATLKNNRKIKNNRRIKAMGNATPTMEHYLRNG